MKCKVCGKEIKIEGECKYCEDGFTMISYPYIRKEEE